MEVDQKEAAVGAGQYDAIVVGARVAGAVGARRYRERPVRSFASHSYWSGVPVCGGELYQRPGRAVVVFPTNDELTMVYAAAPMTEFAAACADLDGHFLRTLDLCGDLGEYFTLRTVARMLGSRAVRQLTRATANQLSSGPRHREPARPAGARASRVPGRLRGARRCGN